MLSGGNGRMVHHGGSTKPPPRDGPETTPLACVFIQTGVFEAHTRDGIAPLLGFGEIGKTRVAGDRARDLIEMVTRAAARRLSRCQAFTELSPRPRFVSSDAAALA